MQPIRRVISFNDETPKNYSGSTAEELSAEVEELQKEKTKLQQKIIKLKEKMRVKAKSEDKATLKGLEEAMAEVEKEYNEKNGTCIKKKSETMAEKDKNGI